MIEMKTRTKRFLKLTIGAEVRKQIVVSVKIRRGDRATTTETSDRS